MAFDLERYLTRWQTAGLVDHLTADRIRAFEREQTPSPTFRWPIVLALSFGALLLGAGVLLFVSAHWDNLPPIGRMALVLAMVTTFHVAGAFISSRFEWLAISLHTIGTIALGAGIALTGQIFNLAEHWPGAIMLWALGAALGWAVLRHWSQAALTAILAPAWLASEWLLAVHDRQIWNHRPVPEGLCLLSLVYLSARRSSHDDALRRALGWIGGITLIPLAVSIVEGSATGRRYLLSLVRTPELPLTLALVAWCLALVGPLVVASLLRKNASWVNGISAVWICILAAFDIRGWTLLIYAWYALGAIGLIAWGVWEGRRERINLGVAGFAITVLTFYFSNVMDKLGRSASLIGLGLLFLAGGWVLEKTRRKLIAQVRAGGV